MSKKSLGSIINEVLREKNAENEANSRRCYRWFKQFIENIGGDIAEMKNANNVIEFEEDEVPSIKFLIESILESEKNPIGKFIRSDEKNFSAEDARKMIEHIASGLCSAEDKIYKEKVVNYLTDFFMLSHIKIIEECHRLVDTYACSLQHQVRSEQIRYLELLRYVIANFLVRELVNQAIRIEEISQMVELYKDGEEEIDCIYEGYPIEIQSEYVQRDKSALRAIQEDDDLRAYVEKKIGKKAEDIFNYVALTDLSVIFKKKDTDN